MLNKNKKNLFIIIATLVMIMGFSFTNVQAASIKRMNGKNRVDTANKTAIEVFKKSESAILVNGTRYPDAVSAAPLSRLENAPILMTMNGGNLEKEVMDTLNTISAKKVYIIGSAGVVSSQIENQLKAKGFQVIRYAGPNRYDTNIEVAKVILAKTNAKTAFLVNAGESYADAISVTTIAATKGYPILFANLREVPTVVKKFATDNKLEVLAVGSSGILPNKVVSSVKGTRITPDDKAKNRFQTNLTLLEYFKKDLDFSKVYVAMGGYTGGDGETKFADALVGSAAASKIGAPLVLNGVGSGPKEMENAEKFIVDNIEAEGELYIIGSSAVVSDDIEQRLDEKVGDFRILDIF
ncbi:cell wall-binding repeat-containing protein [Clostridium sporogenes]|uniref:cell wall-binding repeat-containing protein n=1 Tax=Clostridium sporogenes TaxID=1509 RepID=UPI0013D395E9|nr:cell wall-binding repeat-containing protein [Clostridium sporogenes]MCW6111352.1 cell wall-binding repeat-containing protein [Clostridium sporogenes]NFP93275.1 cell wall-binding repeat-containing protein [Clostridium sporogenes]